jgi:hypothetical protein
MKRETSVTRPLIRASIRWYENRRGLLRWRTRREEDSEGLF